MVHLQLKVTLELFMKRMEFLPGFGFLSCLDMTYAIESEVKINSFLPFFSCLHRVLLVHFRRQWVYDSGFLSRLNMTRAYVKTHSFLLSRISTVYCCVFQTSMSVLSTPTSVWTGHVRTWTRATGVYVTQDTKLTDQDTSAQVSHKIFNYKLLSSNFDFFS